MLLAVGCVGSVAGSSTGSSWPDGVRTVCGARAPGLAIDNADHAIEGVENVDGALSPSDAGDAVTGEREKARDEKTKNKE